MRLHPAPRALRRAMPKDWKRWKYGFNHGSRFHRVLPLMTQVIRATLFKSAGDGTGWKGSAKKGNVRDAMHTLLPLHTKSSVTQQSFILYSLHHHWFILCSDRVSQPFPGCIWTAKVTTSKAAAHLSVFLNLLLMRLHPAPRALRRAMPKDWKRWKYGFNHGSRFHRVLPPFLQSVSLQQKQKEEPSQILTRAGHWPKHFHWLRLGNAVKTSHHVEGTHDMRTLKPIYHERRCLLKPLPGAAKC